jgi:hypothetical protein
LQTAAWLKALANNVNDAMVKVLIVVYRGKIEIIGWTPSSPSFHYKIQRRSLTHSTLGCYASLAWSIHRIWLTDVFNGMDDGQTVSKI